ncbi:helix-turn-helix domain-containing protein [Herbaspirillum lusitanum]|uniref:Helix-turn-helix domain-containing protein n=1 Tax=Herbaspirillum lusitanum TaxID=213312 RepID=A0ABW9ADF2_9BURK
MPKQYSEEVLRLIEAHKQRYAYPTVVAGQPAAAPLVLHQHFTVAKEARNMQASAWSDYVSRILDTPVSHAQRANGFRGEIDSYVLKEMVYLDSRTDPLVQARTTARISRDSVRDYVFHVAVEGVMETATDGARQRKSAQYLPGILALDLGQPMRMVRPSYARVLAFFMPRARVEAAIPDPEALHGAVVAYTSPLTRLLCDQLQVMCDRLPHLPPDEAQHAILTCADLILAAFSKQQRLEGGARAAVRAAIQMQVKQYIEANLHHKELSPESILKVFPIPRPSLYRMFEAEGGLATYIRNCRLREAADELIRLPRTPVMEIAYGMCFSSASDFTRAFHRTYGMAPQDFRAIGQDVMKF